MSGNAEEITELLAVSDLDRAGEDKLFRLIESRFRHIAQVQLGREWSENSMQKTVLVTDAFRKLIGSRNTQWQGREQFFSAAAKVMRQLLVDHARERLAQKRGGGERGAQLDNVAEPVDARSVDPQMLVELNDLVEQLESVYPEQFEVFNLHYFMGYELLEIAEHILDVSYTTVKRRWTAAKAFLARELG